MSGEVVVVGEHLSIPGWYGKLPALGDFASRRLPQPFIDTWDGWLQHCMAASRAALGERWLDAYLHSPIWRFALLPGTVGDSAWVGVLMPSVDKVGRHFPLTVALPLEALFSSPISIVAAQSWYAELERVALATLDIDYPAERLETELAALPFPAPAGPAPDAMAVALAHWWQGASPACSLTLPCADALAGLLSATAHCMLAESVRGRSLWWTAGEAGETAPLHCFTGLPPDERYADLLRGAPLNEMMAP